MARRGILLTGTQKTTCRATILWRHAWSHTTPNTDSRGNVMCVGKADESEQGDATQFPPPTKFDSQS